jgi:hypothetical protein
LALLQWRVIAYDEYDKPDDPKNDEHYEPWYITKDLIECIAEFYIGNPTADNVRVIEQQDEENDDGNKEIEAEVVEDEEKQYY